MGLRGVTAQVFQHPYIYIYIYYSYLEGRKKRKRKDDEVDDPKPRPWRPARAQSHGPAPKARASCRCSKMRPTAGKTSQTDIGSWGMFWMGSMPRSTGALEISTTSYDSRSALEVNSSLILSTRVGPVSLRESSCPLVGCRPCSSFSASIAPRTSKSLSFRQRRIWHSFNV
jgi:hypothetical protein